MINGTTVEYPDEISFCFNPVVINVSGYTGSSIGMAVIDTQTGSSHTEKERCLVLGVSLMPRSLCNQLLIQWILKMWIIQKPVQKIAK